MAYTLMAAVDRHNILYVHPVDDESWLSPAPNILFFLQNTIFVGFTFMLVATGAYYLLLTGWVRIVCFSANVLFLAISIFVKRPTTGSTSQIPGIRERGRRLEWIERAYFRLMRAFESGQLPRKIGVG